ncbi:hypothetical protein [Parasitella parasitica]|uniref:Reverse transcriptase domain-containing protein n=1 Tax=Parasitella parasitica TaxID=35722 RepID=A0A0B7NGD5_9FUNG|nr:hypothetical protein [Parasitella parasitica]
MEQGEYNKAIARFSRIRKNRATKPSFSSLDPQQSDAGTIYSGTLLHQSSAALLPQLTEAEIPFTQADCPFDIEEIQDLIKNLPRKKALGTDHITAEMLIPVSDALSLRLLPLFTLCWCWSYTPFSWRVAQVVPIHKKGPTTDPGNFRPISLTSVFRKLFKKSIHQALQASNPQLDIAKGSFREYRSSLDQVLCLTEVCYRWNPRKCVIVAPPRGTQEYRLYDTNITKEASFSQTIHEPNICYRGPFERGFHITIDALLCPNDTFADGIWIGNQTNIKQLEAGQNDFSNSLWQKCEAVLDRLDRRTFNTLKRASLQDSYDTLCRQTLAVDPIPWLPMTRMERSQPTNAQYRASWAVRWPAICLILFELDHIFHDEEVPPAPPNIGASLAEWWQSQAQSSLLEAILKAQASVISEEELSHIRSNMDKVAIYHTKLLSLTATMSMLAGRSKQLKDRAAKLQELKMKYLSDIDEIRKLEREKDQTIAARTSVSTPTLLPSPTTPDPAVPSTASPPATIPKLVKKKTKARQALIDDGGGDDGESWKPKKSPSQQRPVKK